mmetsp:Transcript_112721/g.313625  ORF Transcript_112721/g.313625 Transcript_112721/m.313625 type:complete len:115 (+) Transcript_112721:69-413(+)
MAMARHSRSAMAPVAALVALAALALWGMGPAFVPPQQPALHGLSAELVAASAAVALPAAAGAAPEVVDLGSSLSLAGLTEVLMCGIVMGVVPTTILGLMVAAWLQFKKGPTLGL